MFGADVLSAALEAVEGMGADATLPLDIRASQPAQAQLPPADTPDDDDDDLDEDTFFTPPEDRPQQAAEEEPSLPEATRQELEAAGQGPEAGQELASLDDTQKQPTVEPAASAKATALLGTDVMAAVLEAADRALEAKERGSEAGQEPASLDDTQKQPTMEPEASAKATALLGSDVMAAVLEAADRALEAKEEPAEPALEVGQDLSAVEEDLDTEDRPQQELSAVEEEPERQEPPEDPPEEALLSRPGAEEGGPSTEQIPPAVIEELSASYPPDSSEMTATQTELPLPQDDLPSDDLHTLGRGEGQESPPSAPLPPGSEHLGPLLDLEQEHTLSPAARMRADDVARTSEQLEAVDRRIDDGPEFPPKAPSKGGTDSHAVVAVSGEHVGVEGELPKGAGRTQMYIPMDAFAEVLAQAEQQAQANEAQAKEAQAKEAPPDETREERKKKRRAINQTVMFGMESVPEAPEKPHKKRTTADLEEMAGGKLQASFPVNEATSTVATAAFEAFQKGEEFDVSQTMPEMEPPPEVQKPKKKKRKNPFLAQTIAVEDIAAEMAKMARDSGRPAGMGQTMNMEPLDIQKMIQDMGGELEEPEVDEKIEDATEAVAQAEKAVDDGDIDGAIELYLALMRSFPQDRGYQQRLEQLFVMLRESVAAQPAPRSIDIQVPMDTEDKRRLNMIWGGSVAGVLALFLVLGLVWPGFLKPKPASTPPVDLRPQTPAITKGTLQINTTPAGAAIWLNGKATGFQTPKTFQREAGTYQLVLKLDGYFPLRKKLQLKAGQLFSIEFGLSPKEPAPAIDPPIVQAKAPRKRGAKAPRARRPRRRSKVRLRIRSTPSGARISIDDRDTGKRTPSSFWVAAGRYQVELKLAGHQTYIRGVGVYRNKLFRIRLAPSNTSQTQLSLQSKPSGAAIQIDGKDTGKRTPATLHLSAATYKLVLSKDGYQKARRKLSLKKGETRRLTVRLSKRGPAGMLYIPGGPFWMGNNAGISREKPMRRVTLSGFWIDRYEVSSADYKACVAAGRCSKAGRRSGCTGGKSSKAKHPINCVSWYQAFKYCRWKKKRLPTEAQWEKAARGTSTRLYPWGHSSPSCSRAIFGRRCGGLGTFPVGSRPAGRSPFGAYDMAGNVWEWVRDHFDRNFYRKSGTKNPYNRLRTNGYRVIRGGSWSTSKEQLHVTYRLEYWPGRSSNTIGFRCAR